MTRYTRKFPLKAAVSNKLRAKMQTQNIQTIYCHQVDKNSGFLFPFFEN